jgi:hypothetical protein
MNYHSFIARMCVLAMFCIAPLRLFSAEPEFYYYYRGQKKALQLDDEHLAVKLASRAKISAKPSDSDARAFSARAASLGYQANESTGFKGQGWLKMATRSAAAQLRLPAQASRKERHNRLLDDLSRLPDVEFVAPIFKDEKGEPVIFESLLLVGFREGTSDMLQADTLKKITRATTVEQHGRKNRWLVRTAYKNGLELLDIANELSALPHVRYADPNYIMTAELL